MDAKTTDYCVQCGESPESGTHVMDHEYLPPARLAEPPPVVATVVEQDDYDELIIEKTPAPLDDELDVEGYELAANTVEGIDVDATWRALRRPVTSLQEARALLQAVTVTEDIGIDEGRFAVTAEDGVPVALFDELDDARLFLSARKLVELLAAETHRANLAESQVAGLEGTLRSMREYDLDHPDVKDPVDGHHDVLAGFELEQLDEKDPHRPISIRPMTSGDDEFYVGAREARRAAAQLWRAADEEDAARSRRARGEVTSEDPDHAAPTPAL